MAEEIVQEYISSLNDLTTDSKPLIAMLTMVAEENCQHAAAIVGAIESHIEKVIPDVKIFIIKLIDSIVKDKSASAVYVPLFTNNIVQVFTSVFDKVSEETRRIMFKLRSTWNDIFSPRKMYILDLRVQHIDKAWPISAPAPVTTSVHAKRQNLQAATKDSDKVVTPSLHQTSIFSSDYQALMVKQRQVYQTIQQKVKELELMKQEEEKTLHGDQPRPAVMLNNRKSEGKENNLPLVRKQESSAGNKKRTTNGNISGPVNKRIRENDALRLLENKNLDERFQHGRLRALPQLVNPDASRINDLYDRDMRFDAVSKIELHTSEHPEAGTFGGTSTRRVNGSCGIKESMASEQTWYRLPNPGYCMGDVAIPPADPKLVVAASDPVRYITVDGHPRVIRYYGNTAVVMLSFNDARQISFENGVRHVFIAGISIPCQLNGPAMQFLFRQIPHTVRLGAPTRELYINDRYHDVLFGGPLVYTELVGVPCAIQLEGPPPQVRIEPHSTNLCLGFVYLFVDGLSSFPIYLDAKPQRFSIDGQPLVLRFLKQLTVILINEVPVPLVFGGSPVPINFHSGKHFLRLTELPAGIIPGRVAIWGMEEGSPQYLNSISVEMPILQEPAYPPVFVSPRDEIPVADLPIVQNSQINEILQSIVTSEIIPKHRTLLPEKKIECSSCDITFLPSEKKEYADHLDWHFMQNRITKEKPLPVLKSINFSEPTSLETKQPGAHLALYYGKQCNQCGIRFHPNKNDKYIEHLDWHFRQNKRAKATRGLGRPWYFKSDQWKEFAEIETSDERAKSWFEIEAQKNKKDVVKVEQPSAPAPRESGTVRCYFCHDRFDSFFHDDAEEWHLKNCIAANGSYYHPACHADAEELAEREIKDGEKHV